MELPIEHKQRLLILQRSMVLKKVYDEIDDVFDDENVDIIYLATSHNTLSIYEKALEHGKHLFVEKSITLNSRELDEMIALAKEKI